MPGATEGLRPVKQHPALDATVVALLGILAVHCRDSGSGPTPEATPTPVVETWFVIPVSCPGCPGLTDVVVDRTTTPPHAELGVGKLTSIRAVAKVGCGTEQSGLLKITRWEASDPRVIKVEASGDESAIVTALAVGTSRLSAERVLPNGTLSMGGLRDSFRADPPCPAQPELLLEVVP
jgi:hypothetical protein